MSDTGIVNIHGKQYETVALRIRKFRDSYPKFTMSTEIIARDGDCVVMRAVISDEAGRVIATGHSEEQRKASQINRTSALENAETSAIGRALAAFGLGGTEFATADEVANAIGQQKASTKSVAAAAWDDLSPAEQKEIQNIADCVRVELETKGAAAALALIEEQGLDNDDKIVLASRFDSKERAALKAASQKKAA